MAKEGAYNLAFLAQQHRLVFAKTTAKSRVEVLRVVQRVFAEPLTKILRKVC